jgi:hypothetical protein
MGHATSLFISLSNRCLMEPASRALDASIYCIVAGVIDQNSLTSASHREARIGGFILIDYAGIKGWIEAPPYTSDLGCAKLLVPPDLATISREPRIVCATALVARAILESPSLPFVGWRGHRQAVLPPP